MNRRRKFSRRRIPFTRPSDALSPLEVEGKGQDENSTNFCAQCPQNRKRCACRVSTTCAYGSWAGELASHWTCAKHKVVVNKSRLMKVKGAALGPVPERVHGFFDQALT